MKYVLMFMFILMTAASNGNGRGSEEITTPMCELVEAVKNHDYSFEIQTPEDITYSYEYDDISGEGRISHEIHHDHYWLTTYTYISEG